MLNKINEIKSKYLRIGFEMLFKYMNTKYYSNIFWLNFIQNLVLNAV